jgi:hypothetical protein
LNSGFNWGGRINGRSNFKQLIKALDIDKETMKGYVNVSTDFNGHDNNVGEEKIVLAFAILRCCYPDGGSLDNIFMYLLSGMVFKRLVLPESGIVYEVTKGVLTGHAFTSIITTLCAYITLSTSINESCSSSERNKTSLQGAGDDWMLRVPRYKVNFIHNNIQKSGNPCDSFVGTEGNLKDTYPNQFPTLLKKHYCNGLISWNVDELFTNFSHPTSTKMVLRSKIDNMIVMCVSGPFSNLINYCVRKLIIYEFINYYCRGRYWFNKRSIYQYYFDRVYKALIHETNINKILQTVPSSMEFAWFGQLSGGTSRIPVRKIISDKLKEMDAKVSRSKAWMLRPSLFNLHESVRRLKVFDVNKKYITCEVPYYRNGLGLRIHKWYIHNNVVFRWI